MNEKISNKLLAIPIALTFSIIAIFCFFCIGLSRVDAQSYYFEAPRNHRLCEGPFNNTIACHNENSTIVNSASPGLQKGNYIIATYRADLNINGVSGTAFESGNYSVEFAGYFTTIQNTDIDTKVIKAKLLYYPSSANDYAVATCDNSESFRVTKTKTDENYNFYYYSYTCETLQITTGKTFLGYQVYVDTTALVNYIDYSYITKNLTLIGEGDASNNDVISNATQNAQDIINNANQNTDKITDAIEKSEETNQGILDVITNFFSNFFDGLIGIFVPNNFDFLTGFLDTLENKLGFIASVPIQFLEFLANLVTIDFDTVNSVSLPHFEILGYTFIDAQEIDLTEIMAVFQPYRIYTNIGCVCLCIRYLMKLYENFANKE